MADIYNFSFKNSLAKLALMACIVGATGNAIAQKAVSSTKTEQTTNAIPENVLSFQKAIGVEIPSKFINYANTALDAMDADEKSFAAAFFKKELATIAPEEKEAFTMIFLNSLQNGRKGEEDMQMLETYYEQCSEWINTIDNMTRKYFSDLVELNKKIIASKEANIASKEANIAKTEANIASKEANIAKTEANTLKNNKESEDYIQKIYQTNPKNTTLITLCNEAKKAWDTMDYRYSQETAEIFAKLGIK